MTKFTKVVEALGRWVDSETAFLNAVSDEQAALKVGDLVEWDGIEWTVRNLVESHMFPQVQVIENGPRRRVRNAPRKCLKKI